MDRSLFLKLKAALSEVVEEERKNIFKNEGIIFLKSGFRMHTKSALSYLDNLYKLENIFKNNGNKEVLQNVEKEIQSINTQFKNKKIESKAEENKIINQGVKKYLNCNK